MIPIRHIGPIGLIAAAALLPGVAFAEPILIGSKKFTESYVLAEIAKRAIANTGVARGTPVRIGSR